MEQLLFTELGPLGLDVVTRRSIEKLRRDLGDTVTLALKDPDITDIMLNPDKTIWIENSDGMQEVGKMEAGYSESLINVIASLVKQEVGANNPVLECSLPYHGARFEGLLPPVVKNPSFAIRKHATKIYTLQDYVDATILTEAQRDVITNAVLSRKNILIAGSTGSGKTTFTNAVIRAIEHTDQEHRLIVIEDTGELQIGDGVNNTIMQCGMKFSMLQALKVSMRFNPDRIIVGEVRGGEALSLLKSWNTGHSGGCCTLHANSARASLIRMEQLISESSATPMQELIAEAIDIIIFISRDDTHKAGRVIKEIVKLDSYTNGQYQLTSI